MSDDDGVPVLDPPEPLIRLLESRPVPSATPEFTGPSRGWPPQIDGVENGPRLDSTLPEDDLNGPRGEQILRTALADERVQRALGERFAHISIDAVELEKGATSESDQVSLTFFSHSHNVAVEVRVHDSSVEAIERREGFQPAEGETELHRAIELARTDSRLGRRVLQHDASAILAWPPPSHRLAAHRIMWVTFTPRGEYYPTHAAAVDLTDESVVHVGPRPWR